jgi:hypothetical protein
LGNRQINVYEIYNLYNNLTYRDLSLTPLINFDSRAGVIKDFTGKAITNTATTIERSGSIWTADFNGTTSKLDYGNIDPLTGDITICGWVKARGVGENNGGRVLDNGAVRLAWNGTAFGFSRNNSTVSSGRSDLKFNVWYFVCITSTGAGISNDYSTTNKIAPVLGGTANQSSGTPVTGYEIIIGNTSSAARTWNGSISQLRVYKNTILTLPQMTQFWSSTVGGYQ